jgi:hypothetical protein
MALLDLRVRRAGGNLHLELDQELQCCPPFFATPANGVSTPHLATGVETPIS